MSGSKPNKRRPTQKEQVRRVFTEKADSYAANKPAMDRVSYEWMLKLSRVQPADRVLDIATGPGFIALLFAEHARHVAGIDLTRALLEKAKKFMRERNLNNVNFIEGDVEFLPFAEGAFDLVTCHKAFHHFPRPGQVLAEIHRTLRKGGRLTLGDTISSEDPAKNEFHNRLERLRDPSHVQMYSVSQLRQFIERAGFFAKDISQFNDERDFETWMKTITPPGDVIEKIRGMMIEGIPDDRTGQNVRLVDGKLYYMRHSLVLTAVKK